MMIGIRRKNAAMPENKPGVIVARPPEPQLPHTNRQHQILPALGALRAHEVPQVVAAERAGRIAVAQEPQE